jgi:hypothetical protein
MRQRITSGRGQRRSLQPGRRRPEGGRDGGLTRKPNRLVQTGGRSILVRLVRLATAPAAAPARCDLIYAPLYFRLPDRARNAGRRLTDAVLDTALNSLKARPSLHPFVRLRQRSIARCHGEHGALPRDATRIPLRTCRRAHRARRPSVDIDPIGRTRPRPARLRALRGSVRILRWSRRNARGHHDQPRLRDQNHAVSNGSPARAN